MFTHFVRGSDGLPLFSIALPLPMALQIALIASVCGVLAAVAPARRAAALDRRKPSACEAWMNTADAALSPS